MLPEVSNDDEWDEWEVRVEYGEETKNLRGMLDSKVKNSAGNALKQAINRDFVQPLN